VKAIDALYNDVLVDSDLDHTPRAMIMQELKQDDVIEKIIVEMLENLKVSSPDKYH